MSSVIPQGLYLEFTEPVWYSQRSVLSDSVHKTATAFSMEKGADGGCLSSSLSASIPAWDGARWLSSLGYDMVVYNQAAQNIWQGFVNKVTVNNGGTSYTVGPLLDMATAVRVTYQAVSYNTNPPIGGQQAVTSLATSAVSISRYGRLETVLSGGQGLLANMEDLRDSYLAEYRVPFSGQDVTLASGNAPSVELEMLGYQELLGRAYFAQSGTGNQHSSVKIRAVLNSHPTLTFDLRGVTDNTLNTPVYSQGDKTGLDEIKDIVARGDTSDRRYVFRVEPGLAAPSKPVTSSPDDLGYVLLLGNNGVFLETSDGVAVLPWDVNPGVWLLNASQGADWGVQSSALDMKNDPVTYMFIERMSYSAPNNLVLYGGRVSRLGQKLAKMGLGGM
jgi:hypothetical protein